MCLKSSFILLVQVFHVAVQGNVSVAKVARGVEVEGWVQSPRVIGGQNAARGQFPYLVRLIILFRDGTFTHCAGTIYNEKYVVTAAHCVRRNPRNVVAVTGDYSHLGWDPTEVPQKVTKIIMHENFHDTIDNDVALLKIDPPITYTRSAHAPEFPGVNFNYSAGHAEVSGWGFTQENGTVVDILQFARVDIVDHATCKQMYAHNLTILDTHMCAGGRATATCDGDSGGPLSFITTESKCRKYNMYVIGIVSSGVRCGQTGYPGIFMKMEKYLGWLKSKAV